MPLLNCEVCLALSWSKNCVITDERTLDADRNANPPVLEIRVPAGATFKIEDTKQYAPVALSTEYDNIHNRIQKNY